MKNWTWKFEINDWKVEKLSETLTRINNKIEGYIPDRLR